MNKLYLQPLGTAFVRYSQLFLKFGEFDIDIKTLFFSYFGSGSEEGERKFIMATALLRYSVRPAHPHLHPFKSAAYPAVTR